MTQPLSPLSPADSNRNVPSTVERKREYSSPLKHAFVQDDIENIAFDSPIGPPSSPFVADVEPSPIRSQGPSRRRSPQKEQAEEYQSRPLTEDALRENEGLTRAIQTMVEEHNENDQFIHDDMISTMVAPVGYPGMDDTAFSAFSAVPNADMTKFARSGQSPTKSVLGSPTKSHRDDTATPRATGRNTPSRTKQHYDDDCPSPTPRHHQPAHDNDTTNLLVDFTGEFSSLVRPSSRPQSRNGRLSLKKFPTQPDLASYASGRRTPSPAKYCPPPSTPSRSRNFANLLDFDLPPAPTPRSIPSISARELESMKSAFQSQISSMKAELSGKEAEVGSLKHAVEDAERRVGEALEEIRNERGVKQNLQVEKAEWEKREKEMKGVLHDVKEEIIRGDREKDQLLQRVSEAEHKREEAESKALEAESKIAGIKASSSSSTAPSENGSTSASAEVEAAVTKVAKELHGLYKSKHEAKVTALKKSYSDRWEKKIRDLQSKIEELSKENEDLRIGRDATMSGVVPGPPPASQNPESEAQKEQERQQRAAELQRFEQQQAKLSSLERELSTLKQELTNSQNQNTALCSQLESSRAETAELIAATEELMLLSQSAISNSNDSHQASSDARSTLSRSTSSSGLKAPGFGGHSSESRIGRMAASQTSSAYGRDGGGSGVRSGGLLSNIERMGRGRAVE
ncbi:hypothetical protein MMC28_000521 [Mycoblastus sanguinarius]|nr:hypothetical protein [Mycoblastus sanguinarius]